MSRLVVTGATGFIGSRLVTRLLDCGHTIGAIVRQAPQRDAVDNRASILVHDGSTGSMSELIECFAPEAVIHLATHFVVNHQPADIDRLVESNLRFGCQLLDALDQHNVSKLVCFGTSWQHFETEAYRPVSLYAATKQAFEDLAAYYADAGRLQVVSLKITDTYGPGDTRAKLVPSLCRAARTGDEILLSPGEQIVNFTFIEDVLSAVEVGLLRRGEAKLESFSVRGVESVSLQDFVRLFEVVAGKALNVKWGARPYRAREVMQPWAGPLLPNWIPEWSLHRGLRAVI